MDTLNYLSPHKIIMINNDELPFKIYSPDKPWYNDDSSIIVMKTLNNSKFLLAAFVNEFTNTINAYIEPSKSCSIEYITHLYNFKVKINAVTRVR